MKSKEEILDDYGNESFRKAMERYAIEKQIEVLNDIENYINALDNGSFIGWNASEKGGYTTATHSIKMKISELQTKLKSL